MPLMPVTPVPTPVDRSGIIRVLAYAGRDFAPPLSGRCSTQQVNVQPLPRNLVEEANATPQLPKTPRSNIRPD